MVIEMKSKGTSRRANSRPSRGPRTKVVGVGSAGNNAIDRMIEENLQGISFVAVDTDARALARSHASHRIQIGAATTKGLSTGGDPWLGLAAAEESYDDLRRAIAEADMVFVVAGMGGGAGTGATAVIAEMAKALRILTVAVVTRPLGFEGVQRAQVASDGIVRLGQSADCVITIPTERVFRMCDKKAPVEAAFRMLHDVLFQSIDTIFKLAAGSVNIDLDFNNIRATLRDSGYGQISVGHGVGEGRAYDAARAAIDSSLCEFSLRGADRVLFTITHNEATSDDTRKAGEVIQEAVGLNAKIVFGMEKDPAMGPRAKVTLIAAGLRMAESIALEVGRTSEVQVPSGRPKQIQPDRAVDYAEIGDRLRRARTGAGLTQKQVAQWLGMSVVGYRYYESGQRRVSLPCLSKLAAIFGRPVSYFIDAGMSDEASVAPEQSPLGPH